MGLEYCLAEVSQTQELQELRLELAPRNQCRAYVQDNGGKAELLKKEEFDSHYRAKDFIDGPFIDNFGSDPGEPYNPNRQAFGKLREEKVVYCELSEAHQEKARILLDVKKT